MNQPQRHWIAYCSFPDRVTILLCANVQSTGLFRRRHLIPKFLSNLSTAAGYPKLSGDDPTNFLKHFEALLGTMEHQCASRGSTVAPLFISNSGKISYYVFLASIEREPRLDSPLQKTAWPPPVIPLTVWRCVVVPSSCITKGPRTGSNGTSSCELPTATTTDLLFCFFWLLLTWNNSWCWRRKPSHVPWFLGMSEVQNEKSWF